MSRPPCHVALDNAAYAHPDGSVLFAGITLSLADECTGLVGANGAGKSTLARLVAGLLEPTKGSITRRGRVGYLPQNTVLSSDLTVAGMLGIAAPLAALDRLLGGRGDARDVECVGTQWDLRERATATLHRVGLGALSLERSLGMVSGGEGTRLALAALLLQEPDLLVLDEPTNHLDAGARRVVRQLLAEWPRGSLVISHDRALLGGVDRILELSSLGARVYGGGFEIYREQRDVERAAAERDLAAARTEMRRTARDVQTTRERKERQNGRGRRSRADGSQPPLVLNARRERSQSTGARLAADATRQLDEQRERLLAARERVEATERLSFALPPTGLHTSKRVVELRAVSFTYPGSIAPLVTESELTITGAERVAIVGDNGTGKSTLLRLLAGELEPTSGSATLGAPPSRIVALDQTVRWPLPYASLLENFQAYNPDATPAFARQALATFLFRGDRALQPVATLSGGEELRGMLASRLHAPLPPLLLLLDEPTNHLDLESLEAVERALQAYDGALVIVSHDEEFLRVVGITRYLRRDASGRWS